tara:strand:+ start:104 stop:694 length:591 start_codon:yes stop_codon:yes gene_type:complete
MSKKKIIILGAGGHANAVIDVVEKTNKYSIYGIVDKKEKLKKKFGYKIIGSDEDLFNIRKKVSRALISIGQIKSNKPRIKIFQKLTKLSFSLDTIVSKNAYVSKRSNINYATILMDNVHIGPDVNIGLNCIINTSSVIEHDSTIGNHTHISTGAIINGNVHVGNNVFIGSGCVVKNGITISDNKVIPMGTIVKRNI